MKSIPSMNKLPAPLSSSGCVWHGAAEQRGASSIRRPPKTRVASHTALIANTPIDAKAVKQLALLWQQTPHLATQHGTEGSSGRNLTHWRHLRLIRYRCDTSRQSIKCRTLTFRLCPNLLHLFVRQSISPSVCRGHSYRLIGEHFPLL